MSEPLRVLDLFSGIGGFSLGLERAGMRTVMFCEIEPFARRVLAKHWPGVPIHDDVRTLSAGSLAAQGIAVDLVCGGFPCQDISLAGAGAGLAGERSGLWREFARLLGELRPRFAIVENVAALLGRGLGDVLGDLAALGYDAEWHCIPAAAVGAPHRRDRIWLVAHAERDRWPPGGHDHGRDERAIAPASCQHVGEIILADTARDRRQPWGACDASEGPRGRQSGGGGVGADVPYPDRAGLAQWQGLAGHLGQELAAPERGDWWIAEPDVGRVADGVPARVDRLRGLGNAVVPQVVEAIGRAIIAATRPADLPNEGG